jgi:hypothetical protein
MTFPTRSSCLLALTAACLTMAASCSSQVKAEKSVSYRYEPGRSATLSGGIAHAPAGAPAAVRRAIAAGNQLQGRPYRYGGGHGSKGNGGYDCSGTASYVLREAGVLRGSMTSTAFMHYGKTGYGKWISVYARKGHVFLTIAGLRLDTGGSGNQGPRWKPETRRVPRGTVVRHPAGL